LFFWQAEQEVEDTKEGAGTRPLTRAPEQARGEFARIRIDTHIGMGVSNLVAVFIVITTAATLHAKGVTDIQTSAQAAEALRAVAGPLTFAVFAVDIIAIGMLALSALLTKRQSIMAGFTLPLSLRNHGLAGDRDNGDHRRRDGLVMGRIIKTGADG
jgi:Mn2+/Fe2+ NRAMP family transporter